MHLGARHTLAAAMIAIVASGCRKEPRRATETAAGSEAAPSSSGPRIMPAVGPDWAQLLPEAPAGYTPCTKAPMDSRIDESTAEKRAASWRAEAAKARPSLHRADVLTAFGDRDADVKPNAETRVRFAMPIGELEIQFPGHHWTIRTATRDARRAHGELSETTDFLFAPLGRDARVMSGDGSVDTDGDKLQISVDVFLMTDGLRETTSTLARHAEHAIEAITCALEEGPFQRGAYRVATEAHPDGTTSIAIGATSGTSCEPRARSETLVVARRVGSVTVVMACDSYYEAGRLLCKDALATARLRR